jgi:hypothetical protein
MFLFFVDALAWRSTNHVTPLTALLPERPTLNSPRLEFSLKNGSFHGAVF